MGVCNNSSLEPKKHINTDTMYLKCKIIAAGYETQHKWYSIQTALITFGVHEGFRDSDVGLTTILI